MADKQEAPQNQDADGSLWEAQDAILKMWEPEEETPEPEEAQPSDEEESTEDPEEEPQEESTEEESEEESEEDEVSEESEVEEETTEEEDDTPQLYSVKVDGKEYEVTEEELLKGYSRQQDYTRKTQELSEYRKQLEDAGVFYQQEVAKTQEARQQYINSLATAIETNLTGLQEYDKIDWERLKTEDREEYLTKRDEYREAQSNIQKLQQQHTQESQVHAEQYQQNFNQWAQEEYGKLVEIIPEWGVPEKQKAIASGLRDFAYTKGFSEDEIKQLFDHRSILILMQAKAWEDDQRRVQKIKTKKVKNKPKVTKTGKGIKKADSNRTQRTAKMKRLKQTGRVDDAASLLEDLLKT